MPRVLGVSFVRAGSAPQATGLLCGLLLLGPAVPECSERGRLTLTPEPWWMDPTLVILGALVALGGQFIFERWTESSRRVVVALALEEELRGTAFYPQEGSFGGFSSQTLDTLFAEISSLLPPELSRRTIRYHLRMKHLSCRIDVAQSGQGKRPGRGDIEKDGGDSGGLVDRASGASGGGKRLNTAPTQTTFRAMPTCALNDSFCALSPLAGVCEGYRFWAVPYMCPNGLIPKVPESRKSLH